LTDENDAGLVRIAPIGINTNGVISCDQYMISTQYALSFDRSDSAIKINHTCSSQAFSRIQKKIDISDFRKLAKIVVVHRSDGSGTNYVS
jgi:hypothetical protein